MGLVNQTHGVLSTLGAVIIARETSQSSWGRYRASASFRFPRHAFYLCAHTLVPTQKQLGQPVIQCAHRFSLSFFLSIPCNKEELYQFSSSYTLNGDIGRKTRSRRDSQAQSCVISQSSLPKSLGTSLRHGAKRRPTLRVVKVYRRYHRKSCRTNV